MPDCALIVIRWRDHVKARAGSIKTSRGCGACLPGHHVVCERIEAKLGSFQFSAAVIVASSSWRRLEGIDEWSGVHSSPFMEDNSTELTELWSLEVYVDTLNIVPRTR